MTNFIIGAICGIAALLLLGYIICKTDDIKIKKKIGEDFVTVIMSKSDSEKFIKYMNEQL